MRDLLERIELAGDGVKRLTVSTLRPGDTTKLVRPLAEGAYFEAYVLESSGQWLWAVHRHFKGPKPGGSVAVWQEARVGHGAVASYDEAEAAVRAAWEE